MMLEGVSWLLLFAGVMIVCRFNFEWRSINRSLARLCEMPHERYLEGLGPGSDPNRICPSGRVARKLEHSKHARNSQPAFAHRTDRLHVTRHGSLQVVPLASNGATAAVAQLSHFESVSAPADKTKVRSTFS